MTKSRDWIGKFSRRRLGFASVAVAAAMAAFLPASSTFAADARGPLLAGERAVAISDNHVWVAVDSYLFSGLSEFDASTGAPIRRITSRMNGLRSPGGVSIAEGRVWFTDSFDNSMTELNERNGSIVRVIKGQSSGLDGPGSVVADGEHVWVINFSNVSIAEFSATSGRLLRVIHFRGDQLTAQQAWGPEQIVSDGDHVWVSNTSTHADSIIELNPGTGAIVRTVRISPSTPNSPFGHLALDGSHLWVSDADGTTLILVNTDNGAIVRRYDLSPQLTAGVNGMAQSGSHLWISGYAPSRLIELDWRSGAITRVIRLSRDEYNNSGNTVASQGRIWVPVFFLPSPTEATSGGLVEFDAANGSIIRTVR